MWVMSGSVQSVADDPLCCSDLMHRRRRWNCFLSNYNIGLVELGMFSAHFPDITKYIHTRLESNKNNLNVTQEAAESN